MKVECVKRLELTPGYLSNNIHMKTIHIRDFNNQGNKISCTVDVKDGKDVITSETIEFRNETEMNSRLKAIKNTANQVAEAFPILKAKEGEWVEPVNVVPEPVGLSDEEKLALEEEVVRAELRQAKNDFDIGLVDTDEYSALVTKIKDKSLKVKKVK